MKNKFLPIISILILLFGVYIVFETIFVQKIYHNPAKQLYEQENSSKEIFRNRRQHTRRKCQSEVFPILNHFKHILVDQKRKIIFCVVPKVACTNWKRILISLETGEELFNIRNPHSHNFNYLSNTSDSKSNYTKILFVRHPFERLVSAFENKIHKPFSDYFRTRLLKEGMKNLSFAAFVDFILSKKPQDLNEHWAPQNLLCLPCHMDYDFIGKYENIARDSDFILQNILKTDLRLPQIKSQSPIGRTAILTPQYMSNLSQEAQKNLFELYKKDFELFDYSLQ
uniref:Carbohydrate sulfotransferase n=1 Tax=Lepeophtheirus salmonis TaxID=72036 RepID=A0A0K2UGE8_LEPSM